MESIKLDPTEDTPQVILDRESKTFLIKGESLPEDAAEFYAPIYEWFEKYVEDPETETILEIQLDYVNSSSVKRVFSCLCLLEEIEPYHNKIEVQWKYKKGDNLMKEKGEEFADYLEVPFNLIEV